MAKHTPGPWHLSKAGHYTIFADDEVLVADCDTFDPRQPPAEQIEFNARLIIAAPDMLAALNGLIADFDVPEDGSQDHTIEPNYRRALKRARAAVDKAKGDTR